MEENDSGYSGERRDDPTLSGFHEYGESDPGEDSYWYSVLLTGAVIGVFGFLINLAFGYMQIGSEPSGGLLSPVMMGSVVVCLATALGGLAAVWHYAGNVSAEMTLGRGALIGFLTGVAIVVMTALLNQIWQAVDPGYTERLIQSVVQSIDAMNLPSETRDQLIDQLAAGTEPPSLIEQVIAGIPVTGLLNLITGLLGVKLFASRDEPA